MNSRIPLDRPRPKTAAALVSTLLLAMTHAACTPGPPPSRHPCFPVKGQVLFQGKPLAGAMVSFHPVDESRFGQDVPRPTGRTDGEGRFRLTTTITNDGAPTGEYLVTVAGMSRPREEAGVLPGPGQKIVRADPTKGRFVDPKKSGLRAEVKEGEDDLPPFDLR